MAPDMIPGREAHPCLPFLLMKKDVDGQTVAAAKAEASMR
jgi:hypothetical protein